MKKLIAWMLICGLLFPVNIAFAADTPCGAVQFPMGPGGGRSSDPNLNPVKQKSDKIAASNQAAKEVAEQTGAAISANNEQSSNDFSVCLIDIDTDILTNFTLPSLSDLFRAAMDALMSAACTLATNMLMDAISDIMGKLNSISVDIPGMGSVSPANFVNISGSGGMVSGGSGSGGVNWNVAKQKNETLSNAANQTAKNAGNILKNIKPNTFHDRLQNK